ncbi:MAG: hypothetical protein NTU44_17075 [Bacteroidetes bacterium]|nr:hypothetical protein [Bacteroidota bacterium]
MSETENRVWDSVDWENNYKSLKTTLEKAIRIARTTTDLREAKDILIKAQAGFKEIKLRGEHREELFRNLQDEFARINEKMAEERGKFEQEAFFNYTELKLKVEEVVYRVEKETDWREAKKNLIEVQQAFKGLRLIKEQREELYNKVQKAFDAVNFRQQQESMTFQEESTTHFLHLKPLVEKALEFADKGSNFAEIRDYLIQIQGEFRGIKLEKEKREKLYGTLQEAFDILNRRVEETRAKTREVADQNFEYYQQEIKEIADEAATATQFKELRERIRSLQTTLKDSLLLREQKDSLYASLQDSFSLINQRQDQERSTFETEAAANYKRLNKMVADGLQQAQESNEFRETREFLKKIQGEFKGIRMIREHREELYSRLQTAFATLRERTDTYFREKQKNWEVKMEFRLKDLSVSILELQMEITKNREHQEELETQLEIVEQKAGESPARLMVLAQLQSVKENIRKNELRIEAFTQEMEALQLRLGDRTDEEEENQS